MNEKDAALLNNNSYKVMFAMAHLRKLLTLKYLLEKELCETPTKGRVLLARLLFTVLFIVPAFVCLTNDTTTETCGNAVFKQDTKNTVNMAGTLVEAGNSFVMVILIFRWEKFKVTNFLRAAPRLAVFWFWISLFIVQTISTINRDIISGVKN